MKKFSKIISCALVFVMMLSMSCTVFAANTTSGVNSAVAGAGSAIAGAVAGGVAATTIAGSAGDATPEEYGWDDLWGDIKETTSSVINSVKEALKEAERNRIKVKCVNMTATDGRDLKDFYVNFGDVQPVIFNGRTMLPIRAVAEAVGYNVEWDGEQKAVILKGIYDTTRGYNQADSILNMYKTSLTKKYSSKDKIGFVTKPVVEGDSKELLKSEVVNNTITLKIGSTNGYATLTSETLSKYFWMFGNDSITLKYTMDTPPLVIDGRTLIPLRAAAEMMGLQVDWDNETRTAILTALDK